MIDFKALRADPERFIRGARDKGVEVDIPHLLALDERLRRCKADMESRRAEQKRLGREVGPRIGQLKGQLAKLEGAERERVEAEIAELQRRPEVLKAEIQAHAEEIERIEPERMDLWRLIPQPPDPDVPKGRSEDDNVEISRWNPDGFDTSETFESQRGFAPRTHLELIDLHGLVEFERAVKMSGTRHYALSGDGMALHQAVLRCGFDLITTRHGFRPMSVPVIVREASMVGTGFFPSGRDQAYHIDESRSGGHDLFLTGTGEVGLMSLHADEILDPQMLPLKYATVSTCFRREAGSAGKDTAGLYRIHQFDKVEQVVICRADEAESREWHRTMIGIVEELLRALELPHRLIQCCTGDLGVKNADMIDIECWMPSRGERDADDRPLGAYGETHSASRLYDYQCRRLNMRYRDEDGKTTFCHSLNNTVIASPRILIPILEMYQNADGTITIPEVLRPHMQGRDRIG